MDRVEIWKETCKKYENFHEQKSIKLTQLSEFTKEYKYDQEILVIPNDMIDYALELKQSGLNPLLLNMADEKTPGGNVHIGSGAQEEETFRRSNYHKFLDKDDYPLKEIDAIYSKNVEYYRYGANNKYKLLENTIYLDMIAIPAIRFPQLTFNKNILFANENDRDLTKNKMRMIFNVGVINKHDVLVLSAWGCGAFGNPSIEVANLFKEVISEYPNSFKKIVFAILPNAGFMIEDNYSIFKKILL